MSNEDLDRWLNHIRSEIQGRGRRINRYVILDHASRALSVRK